MCPTMKCYDSGFGTGLAQQNHDSCHDGLHQHFFSLDLEDAGTCSIHAISSQVFARAMYAYLLTRLPILLSATKNAKIDLAIV
jgi:hypothetical protein